MASVVTSRDLLTEEYAVRLEELSEGKISRVRAGAILSRYLDESEKN